MSKPTPDLEQELLDLLPEEENIKSMVRIDSWPGQWPGYGAISGGYVHVDHEGVTITLDFVDNELDLSLIPLIRKPGMKPLWAAPMGPADWEALRQLIPGLRAGIDEERDAREGP